MDYFKHILSTSSDSNPPPSMPLFSTGESFCYDNGDFCVSISVILIPKALLYTVAFTFFFFVVEMWLNFRQLSCYKIKVSERSVGLNTNKSTITHFAYLTQFHFMCRMFRPTC